MTDILPLDVAVCDADLLWRVERMNALHSLNVRDFGQLSDVRAALTPGHDSVILVGPSRLEQVLAAVPVLQAEHPEWSVLFVLNREDPARAARVVAAGAATVLDVHAIPHVVELTVAALLSEGEVASAQREDERRIDTEIATAVDHGNVIVVTSPKSGEGVTLIALNLAMAFAEQRDERVAYVEGDAEFGDVSLLLHLPGRPHLAFDRLPFDADSLDRLSVFDADSAVRIVRPPIDATHPPMPPGVARRLVDAVAEQADFIVLDAPFDLVRASGIAASAAAVLLVASAETTSIKNVIMGARELGALGTIHLVVNAGRHGGRADTRRVARATHGDVIGVIPYEAKLEDSMRSLSPHVLRPPHSPFGRACRDLATHLRSRMSPRGAAPGSPPPGHQNG